VIAGDRAIDRAIVGCRKMSEGRDEVPKIVAHIFRCTGLLVS